LAPNGTHPVLVQKMPVSYTTIHKNVDSSFRNYHLLMAAEVGCVAELFAACCALMLLLLLLPYFLVLLMVAVDGTMLKQVTPSFQLHVTPEERYTNGNMCLPYAVRYAFTSTDRLRTGPLEIKQKSSAQTQNIT
jgi:hypothetical protein